MNIVECFTWHSRVGFFCILMLIAFSSVAETEADIDSAISAVESEEYDKALKQFQLLADKGIAEAQHNLAMMYRLGKGTEKNYELSNQWFRVAAEKGISDAQYYLGHAYDVGEGIPAGLGTNQDIEQAYLWFHVAAAQGYRLAFENKEIIEKTLESDVIEELKKKGRVYYQQYVMPFQRHSSSYPRLR